MLTKAATLYDTTGTGGNTNSASGTIFPIRAPGLPGRRMVVMGSGDVLFGTTTGGDNLKTGTVFSFGP